MADFFARDCNIKVGVTDPDAPRIRNNAYVTVDGEGQSLPVGFKGFDEIYSGDRKSVPTLGDVKVSLQGTAGALRKCEFSFTCYDSNQFSDYEKAFLLPGKKVTIKYGYVKGGLENATSGNYEFTIYDYNFEITKENYFTCTARGVGKGMTFEENNMNAESIWPSKEFVTNYNGINEKAKSKNMFDYIDYLTQKLSSQDGDWKFDPPNGKCWKMPDGGWVGTLAAPDNYEPDGKFKVGTTAVDRIIYVSLDAVVGLINNYVFKGEGQPQIKFKSDYSKIRTNFGKSKIFSASPCDMLFPYSSCAENNYPNSLKYKNRTKKSPKNLLSANRYYITANDFNGAIKRLSGGSTSSPKNIALGRDFLRKLQAEFGEAAIAEKTDEEKQNKSDSGITIRQLFNKIFAAIRENSGGAWDFYLEQDDEKEDKERKDIYIVNRKAPSDGPPTACDVTPDGKVGVRELKIEGKVPKAFQAKFAAGAPSTGPTEEEVAQKRLTEMSNASSKGSQPSATTCAEARHKIHSSDFDESAINACKATLKSLVDNIDGNKKISYGQITDGPDQENGTPFPLTLSVTVDGNDDFVFGHTIVANHLPDRYKGSNKVIFTVTDLEHNISNNDWTTTLNTLMRLR